MIFSFYPISFVKAAGDDYTVQEFQDRITDNVWFTRLNNGGPLFNYKYYNDNEIEPTGLNNGNLSDDFYYRVPNAQGGTIGCKWAILSSTGFPDLEAPGINTDLFGTIGNPTNFFSFSQMCTLLTTMIDEVSKPISLINPNNSKEWTLENLSTSDPQPNMIYLENKDLGCYIPAINKYFKINITVWGTASTTGAISYTRTDLYNPSNICFPAGTPVLTDQGQIAIDEINPDINTINQKKIVDITKTISEESFLVCFAKDALGPNKPSQETIISQNHLIFYEGVFHEAIWFLTKQFADVKKVPYTGELLYNVLLEKHTVMNVNNLICETLRPDNPIAKLYTKQCKLAPHDRDIMIKVLEGCLERNDIDSYNKILQCC